ncbi:hypothetical protein F5Y04DRAFT_258392 [Hypomontagnella monticulosa]|nr:hypothetical protein F5Y04DRAFT_258392 [Hypomontagnella monticulosa]
MRYEAVLIAFLAREAAARCKPVSQSGYPVKPPTTSSSSGPGASPYPGQSTQSSYVANNTSIGYPTQSFSGYPVISSSSSGYPVVSSSSSGYPVQSSSSSSGYPVDSSSSSSEYPTSTTSSSTSTSSTACPTPTNFVVGTGSCDCSYDVFDGFAIEGQERSSHDSNSFEDCLYRCDINTDCDSFMYKSRTCRLYGSRVNEGVTAVEDVNAKSGSLILASCRGVCENPFPSSDYTPPVVEDPSTCQTTFAQKPPAFIRTTLEPTTAIQTDYTTATSTEVTTSTPTEVTTTTIFTTVVSTSTLLQVTDTFFSTSTVFSTSVDTSITTEISTSVETSVSTVAPPTTTVPAPAGFTPIKSANGGVVARSVRRLAGRTITSDCPATTPVLNEGDVQTYATAVACGTTITSTVVETPSTTTTVETITADPTTITETSVSTITSVTTEVPTPADYTSTIISTSVISTTTVIPTTSVTTSTTTTTTTVGPTPTVYAQCLANNLATTINRQRINFFSATKTLVDRGKVAAAADCCNVCMNADHCGAFAVTDALRCYTAQDSGVCNGSRKAATIAHITFGGTNFAYVGNGACGQAQAAV